MRREGRRGGRGSSDAAEEPSHASPRPIAELPPTADRWRLVLGTYSRRALGRAATGSEEERVAAALDYLYGREYDGRGLRPDDSSDGPGPGGREETDPALVTWLGEVRDLFPRETAERIEGHALDRYGLTDLVKDARTLERLEPNEALLKTLLALKGHLKGEVLTVARRIIRQVVEDLRRRLETEIRPSLAGRRDQHRHSPVPVAANLDAPGTIRRNLKHYDAERRRLVLEEVLFFQRNTRRTPWDVIICVDQSGSMVGSVVHSAVMAGILAGLPAFRVRLVVFDTRVVDLTEHVADPVEVLLQVQLGGGTDIGQAVRYCRQLVENPSRTVVVLVTDFAEGGPPGDLQREVAALVESRIRVLGLAALDGDANPFYDRQIAQSLADRGMEIAALTPSQLASWLVEVTSR